MSSRIRIPRSYVTTAPECDKSATSLAPEQLALAIERGNRATRRKAVRNLLKKAREWAKGIGHV